MVIRRVLNIIVNTVIPATLNSYSVVFFFNNRLLAIVLLLITFLNFYAGLSGLVAVVATVLIANTMGFDKNLLKRGIFSFNALLTGIGIGTFFEPGLVFFILLLLAALSSLILSVVLSGWLGKYGLPFLSLPFIISFWLIFLPSGQFASLGLTQRNVFWMNEMYAVGGKPLLDLFQTIDNFPLNKMVIIYLKSISSIIFQDNLVAGILIALVLFVSSRIAFLLSITGFISAYLFAHFIGSDLTSFSFYNIGANYILVAIAVGGFFVIPSGYSFLWASLLVPLTSLILLFMTKFLGYFHLPVFSLPFSLVVIMFIYFLILRVKARKLILTPVQHFSPEINLYTFINSADRSTGNKYFPLHLPFWGEWTVSQGYNGKYTHIGELNNALDFVLMDENGKTHSGSSNFCENFYCYNKPVTAPADGIIVDIVDYIDDNEPGKVNTSQNWGNTIIIKHLNSLYSHMSHLHAGTFKVRTGDFVKRGQIIALCGNSGRSPEPHLHFQVQATPLTGAKTLEYPFAYYLEKNKKGYQLRSFMIPSEGDIISGVSTNPLLNEAFNFQPGRILKFKYLIGKSEERIASWEVFTDVYNNKYLYCSHSQSTAYFVNDGTMFYFTSFYGDSQSLLYYFYLTAYKVLLGYYDNIEITDTFPLHIILKNKLSLWLHDFIAPFYQYIKPLYTNKTVWSDTSINPTRINLSSQVFISSFASKRAEGSGKIILAENQIKEFSFETHKTKVWAQDSNALL